MENIEKQLLNNEEEAEKIETYDISEDLVGQHGLRLRKLERGREGKANLYPEEIPDEDTLNIEDMIIEGMEENSENEDENLEEIRSNNRVPLPIEIKKIIAKYSLSPEMWNKLSGSEKKERKSAIQKEIEQYYISRRGA